LSAEDVQRWNDWAAPHGHLISPYFLPDFALAVDDVRGDVEVAVIREGDQVTGYFAHHAVRGGTIRPVGAPMSDYQGIVAAPGANIDMDRVLSACGACALLYDNWHDTYVPAAMPRRDRGGSVICDLEKGPDAYFDTQRGLYRDHFRKLDRRQRKAEATFGPMRVVIGDPSGLHFHTLAAWKSAQYRSTGKLDVLGVPWARKLLRNLGKQEGSPFGTLTAALYFGDHLAAVEVGLKAGGIYHSWFPAYDPAFSKFSPGLLLIHAIIQASDAHGISRVDLGREGAQYKKYYTSWEVPLESGRALAPGLASFAIRGWETAELCAKVLPGSMGELPARARRRWSQVSAFEPDLATRFATFARSLKAEPGTTNAA
tara:strand:+ start:1268 stop:2380 length:1113 start_codon:yes stop_codon:yes gene_type:complete